MLPQSGNPKLTLTNPKSCNAKGFSTSDMTSGNGLELLHKGGAVMAGKVNVYLIFYGDAWDQLTVFKIEHLLRTIQDTEYFGIMTHYEDVNGNKIGGPIEVKPSIIVSSYLGNQISDSNTVQIIKKAYPQKDKNGVYFVLGDKNTKQTLKAGKIVYRSCVDFCGYHYFHNDYKYSFVIDSSTCKDCSAVTTSPNLDLAADATASIIVHELFEAMRYYF